MRYRTVEFGPNISAAKREGREMQKLLEERHLIRPGSGIDGGVFVSHCETRAAQEVITLDFDDSPEIKRLYGEIKRRVERQTGAMREHGMEVTQTDRERFTAAAVFSAVYAELDQYEMELNDERVRNLEKADAFRHLHAFEMPLETVVREHTGVCRHGALLSALLIERFQKERYVAGTVDVITAESESLVGGETQYGGMHTWCAYTCSDKKTIVVDVRNGLLRDMEKINAQDAGWEYSVTLDPRQEVTTVMRL